MSKKLRKKVVKKTAQKRRVVKQVLNLRAALAFGVIFVIIGLFLLTYQFFNIWRAQQTTAASQPIGTILKRSSGDNETPYISGKPAQVTVPSVGIDLKVIPGYYDPKTNSWNLTLDKAQWAVMTPQPNDKTGMTFIYAHYRKGVFYTLPKIKPGEIAKVVTEKGHNFTYKFRASSVVPPQDTSLFNYQGKPILVLQTCTGIRFENRQLFVFDLVKVE